jgi:FMN phosphatase YigB (HAD superfamily)
MIVAFDLMNTLLVDPYREAHEAATGMTFAEFEQRRPYGVYYELERGRIAEEAYWASLRDCGVPVDLEVFHRTRRTGYRWLTGMQDVVADCRRYQRTVIASNYPTWIEQVLADTAGLSDMDFFASYQCGYRKPETGFYLALADAFGTTTDDIVLVDDKSGNVEAIRALGARAVLHVTAPETRRQLAANGVRCEPVNEERIA